MAWTPATTEAERQEFLDILQTHPLYHTADLGNLRAFTDRGGRLWIYRPLNGRWKVAMGIGPHRHRAGAYFVPYCIPTGNYRPEQTMRLCIAHLRQQLDQQGARFAEFSIASDYGDPLLNTFFDQCCRMWEITEVIGKNSQRFQRFRLERSPDQLGQDADMSLRSITRPPRRLWSDIPDRRSERQRTRRRRDEGGR